MSLKQKQTPFLQCRFNGLKDETVGGPSMNWAERLVAINIGLCLDSGIAILEATVQIDWASYGFLVA